MASRKEQKEQARAEREAAQAEADAKHHRQRTLKIVLGAVALLVIIGIVVAVVAGSGDSSGGDASNIQGVSDVDAMIGDIPQSGQTLGDKKAKVTIQEFGDLQCPACKAFSDNEFPTVVKNLIKPGEAKMIFFNNTIIGPDSTTAAKAALAASVQNRYWQFIELFYMNQGIENAGYVSDDFLTSIAKAAGVKNIEQWDADRDKPRWDANLAAVQADAARLGFNSTPSFQIIGPTGQKAVPVDNSAAEIENAVKQVQ